MSVETFLAEKGGKTEDALRRYLATWDGAPDRLRDAVAYSLFAGGKRLRPALALGAAQLASGTDAAAVPVACALEMIHTYSLIHDDLPAMDDDDVRRGRPSCHRQFDEATAILAGDALLTMAFDMAARTGNIEIIRELAGAAGAAGMVGGQMEDLLNEGEELSIAALQSMHGRKTGALLRASVRTGAMAAGAAAAVLGSLSNYGERIGLAFQIADDILNETGDAATLGKATGSDRARGKSTYPRVVGLEEARRLARVCVEDAKETLAAFGPEADTFRALADYVVERAR